ncbi:chaplin [Streptomyces murinus]|uniref:chaplin n=1 Tax=Streptomyces murinus TaxID=33900 RepID=UPI000A3BB53F|nr:chaplin [Streptomyces murinus]
MRQGTRKGLMTMAAATGVLAAATGMAHADAGASGAATGSPGVLSGNTVQVPVHVPVNVCGNTVNVVGLLNPAMGNACANSGGGHGGQGHGGAGGSGGASAGGHTSGSPGVGSGNTVQVPIDVPVNACGNSVDVIGVGNPAMGNDCSNGGGTHGLPPGGGHTTPPSHPGHPGHPSHPGHPGHPSHPGHPTQPGTPTTPGAPTTPGTPHHPGTPATPPAHQVHVPQAPSASLTTGQLAHTGSDLPLGLALPAGAGALIAGAVLYRKARARV